ncbi:MAG TPA: pyruvate formate lyase family protein, partial [Spirochaetales bacterium]|nr:pyruvate formate lyase family protein [Spirochaetales bacterium]
ERKSIYIGKHELIVGERGSGPKVVSTFPELNCHSAEDLRILRSRPMTQYQVDDDTIAAYESKVIPYWRGISIRDRAFSNMPEPWLKLYASGVFTEFMEQRAAGHTALDGLLYREGLLSIRQRVNASRAKLDPTDGRYQEKHDELTAMAIACDAALRFAERHAALAERMAESEPDDKRAQELRTIAQVCRQVPAHAPRNFHEAVQAYWFTHLGTITELNGWDAMSPGHLDQHLSPFYERDVAEGRISQDEAKELLSCLWIKVNNTPAPPKVGVTAQESGTYNDFTNINLGGLLANGQDGSSELSVMILEVLGELKLLQPQANLQLSSKTPKRVLDSACKVIRQGMGYPSIFNADEVVLAQVGMGKSLADAREGGTSGCVETGCFGKEAYMLHGYLNGPKLLELAMNNGIDPANGQHIGPQTGSIASMDSFEKLYAAWEQQLAWAVAWKTRVDGVLDELYGTLTPAPFLSLYIADCIDKGIDYYRGGARYNTDYIQCTGIGTMADSLSVLKTHAFSGTHSLSEFAQAIADNWKGHEVLRALALNKTPLFGNDDSSADSLASRVFDSFVRAIEYDGPNLRVSSGLRCYGSLSGIHNSNVSASAPKPIWNP